MMKITLENINTNKLHDELIVSGIIPLLVESLENTTWITFADGTDMELVQQVIDAHDPTPLPQPKTVLELLKEENAQLKTRLYETEIATAETSSMQEQLIELLIEMGVI